jgi:hypothetical protein
MVGGAGNEGPTAQVRELKDEEAWRVVSENGEGTGK